MSVASTPREPWSHGRRRGLGCLFCFLSFHALHAVKGDSSASQMLQECLVHDTPWCTRNRAFSTITQSFSFVAVRALRRVYPWLAMLRDHLSDLTNTTDAHQLNRLRTAERPTGLIVYERLVQLNLQERLRAPDLRVLLSPCLR